MTRNPFSALLLLLALTAYAQQERVAIIQTLDDHDSIGISDLAYLTDKLRETAVNVLPKQQYGVMTTESIVAFLGSQEEAVKACNESSCLAEVGRKVSADYVAQGRIGRFGEDLTIKVELYDSKKGNLIGSFTGDSKNIYGLRDIINEKASDLFKKMLVQQQPQIEQYASTQPSPQQQNTFDNDKDVQELESKRDADREEARKALERVRFGVKVGGGMQTFGDEIDVYGGDVGIMINIPLSRIKDGYLFLATELNLGDRLVFVLDRNKDYSYEEIYLNIPLMLQYVSFFYSTSDIKANLLPGPKQHFLMHLKTIIEAGVFIDIPLSTKSEGFYTDNRSDWDYKDRSSFDFGGIVGVAVQLENFILGIRGAASYIDFGSSSLLLQGKAYLGYLF